MAGFDFGMFTAMSRGNGADDPVLVEMRNDASLTRAARRSAEGRRPAASRVASRQRKARWRLHVSAAHASAQAMFARSLPLPGEAHAGFKLASTSEHVASTEGRRRFAAMGLHEVTKKSSDGARRPTGRQRASPLPVFSRTIRTRDARERLVRCRYGALLPRARPASAS